MATIVLNMNLKELLQFSGKDGKIVIAGEDGEVMGVFLSFDEYQKISGFAGKKNSTNWS